MIKRLKNRAKAWYEERAEWIDPKIEKLKTITLPGLDGVPVWDVALFFWKEVTQDRLATRAKSIAYSFFIALFPAIIFLFTLIPFIPIEGFQSNLLGLIEDLLPTDSAFDALLGPISEIIYRPQNSLLSISLLFAFYFSTDGVLAIMDSFDKRYSLFIQRNFIIKRWIAFKLTLLLFLLFLVSIALIIAGQEFMIWLKELLHIRSQGVQIGIEILRYLIIISLFFFTIGTIFRYAPATKRNWKYFSPGTSLATFLSLVASIGFSFFVSNFGRYNQIYGSIAAVIIVLIWLYINALSLLIGFELNASIYYNKSLSEQEKK